MDISWDWTLGKTSSQEGQCSTGATLLRGTRDLHPWRFSGLGLTKSWLTWSDGGNRQLFCVGGSTHWPLKLLLSSILMTSVCFLKLRDPIIWTGCSKFNIPIHSCSCIHAYIRLQVQKLQVDIQPVLLRTLNTYVFSFIPLQTSSKTEDF